MNTSTRGRVAKLATRLRTTADRYPGADLGPKAVRLVLRELLYEGEGVPEWQRVAACAESGVDREVFYPPDDRVGEIAASAAKEVCARCPVRAACLVDVLAWENPHQRHGVLGGLTPAERAALTSVDGGEAA